MVVQPKKDAGGSFAMDVEAREKIVRQARQGSPEGGRLLPRHVARERIRVEETGKKKVNGVGKRRQANYLQITTPYRVTLKTHHAQTQALTNRLEKKNPLFSKRKRRSQILSLYTPRLLSPSLSEYFLLFYLHISDSSNRS